MLQLWIHVILLSSKFVERTTPRMNSDVKLGLRVIMMCQCRFTDCKKYTTLEGDTDHGGGCAYVGGGSV